MAVTNIVSYSRENVITKRRPFKINKIIHLNCMQSRQVLNYLDSGLETHAVWAGRNLYTDFANLRR